jgi:hypothetical protein
MMTTTISSMSEKPRAAVRDPGRDPAAVRTRADTSDENEDGTTRAA